jgi:preprotein translocase subunit SecA
VQVVEEPPQVTNVKYQHADYDEALALDTADEAPVAAAPFVRAGGKVGRNDACPCGSGKKYKHCHGRLA